MRLTYLVVFGLIAAAFGNTALPSNWVANDYGVCTLPYLEDYINERPPYTGPNQNPLIAEAVSSGSRGRTCNFNPGGNALSGMSALYRDHWVLAASQSLYNGRKMPEDWTEDDCPPGEYTEAEALSPSMCGALCGVCVLASGPAGSAVFMINEIADAGHVGQNGIGINIHIDGDHRDSVRNQGAVAKDIQFAFVSCPTDDGIYIRTFGWYAEGAVYLVLYNYRNRLVSVETRGNGAGADTTWVPMVRSWTNRWQWDTGNCDHCPEFQQGYGSIFRGSADRRYDLRVTDIAGNQVICSGLAETAAGDIVRCLSEGGTHQQFPYLPIEVDEGCTGTTTSNLNYYQGNLPSGQPVSDPSNPSPAPPPPQPATPSSEPASLSRTPTPTSSRTSTASASRSRNAASDSRTPASSATRTPTSTATRNEANSASRTPNGNGVSSTRTAAPSNSQNAAPSATRTRAVSASSRGVSQGTLLTSIDTDSLGTISFVDDSDSSSAWVVTVSLVLLAMILLFQ